VGICDNGDKAGGAGDGPAGGAGGGENVANTLWAYATMGIKPGERMIRLLEGRVEELSGEFNSQNFCKHAVVLFDDGENAGSADHKCGRDAIYGGIWGFQLQT
jgi:hypothetical protein